MKIPAAAPTHVLVVDADRRVAQVIQHYFRLASLTVDITESIADFSQSAERDHYSLHIMELDLPDGSGLDLIRGIRAKGSMTPILVVTRRPAVRDRVRALELGADDCVAKPFHVAELVARAKALIRRTESNVQRRLSFGQVVVDAMTDEIECRGRRIDLRPSERLLLTLLLRSFGRLVPRIAVETAIERAGRESSPNALDKLVSRLRKQLDAHPTGLCLRTVKGAGFLIDFGGALCTPAQAIASASRLRTSGNHADQTEPFERSAACPPEPLLGGLRT